MIFAADALSDTWILEDLCSINCDCAPKASTRAKKTMSDWLSLNTKPSVQVDTSLRTSHSQDCCTRFRLFQCPHPERIQDLACAKGVVEGCWRLLAI